MEREREKKKAHLKSDTWPNFQKKQNCKIAVLLHFTLTVNPLELNCNYPQVWARVEY